MAQAASPKLAARSTRSVLMNAAVVDGNRFSAGDRRAPFAL